MKSIALIVIIVTLCAFVSTQMPGGFKEQNPHDALHNPDVLNIIDYALSTMSTDGSTYGFNAKEYKTVKVLYYATQVVAGLNYKLKVELHNTRTNQPKFAAFIVWRKLGNHANPYELSYSILGDTQDEASFNPSFQAP